MDGFWTPEEAAFRLAAREHFGRREGSGPVTDLGIPSGLGLGGGTILLTTLAIVGPDTG